MKSLLLFIMAFTMVLNLHSQATCGPVFTDTFDDDGALPTEWTEYSTSGSVSVVSGALTFNLVSNTPSAYRAFTAVSNNCSCSFDVEGSRTTMNFQMDFVSADGKYIASIALGKGTTDIKYSTAMVSEVPGTYIAGVIGTPKFAKNQNYSLSLYFDFDNQTVDFYNAGELTLENIPFLEAATDLGKVDGKLLYMYANNGTAILDNLAVVASSETRIALSNALAVSQSVFDAASIGESFHDYPQTAADAFDLVLASTGTVVNDCDASSETMTTAMSDLAAAESAFLSTQVDPVALHLYSSYGFTGDEKEMKCGYYNGDLGAYEDKAVSFKLKKGYMATFAQDVNGAGVSKVYVASEADLAINLPADLQKSISFVRVGPWRDTRKRGSSGKSGNNDVSIALKSSWFYDWGSSDASMDDQEYVVMDWSGGAGIDKMTTMGNTMDITHHLAFNEPDGAKQANMTVDKAIEKYKILQASGLRLGAPAVTDGTKGRAWLDEFMPKAIAAGYRIDFIPVHYYKIMSATAFRDWLKDFYDEYQIPIWVTEFNYGDIWAANEKTKTEAQVLSAMQGYCEMMDDEEFIERYCIFTWQPSETSAQTVMSVRSPVTLNSVGEYYANHESPVAYTQEVYEQGPDLTSGILTAAQDGIKVDIHPNPVNGGSINFSYSTEVKIAQATVRLYDINGREVLVKENSPEQLNVSHLKSGLYLLRIESALGMMTQKVIIGQ